MFSERVDKLFNELKNSLYGDSLHVESNLIDVYMRTYGPRHIELNFIIANRYNNERILHEAILESVDKFLKWIDLSTLNDDFRVSIQYAMGTTHTWSGVNYADAFNLSMTLIGTGCLILGSILLFLAERISYTKPISVQELPALLAK